MGEMRNEYSVFVETRKGKNRVFWNVTPCSQMAIWRHFGEKHTGYILW